MRTSSIIGGNFRRSPRCTRRLAMVIGFEMFPRSVQCALDRWVAGEMSETEFLRESRWQTVWSIGPQLYMPLFHFARMNRVPMIALNVERELTRATRENVTMVSRMRSAKV